MNPKKSRLDMDVLISTLLMIGVLLSAGLILSGVLWQWASAGSLGANYTLPATNLFQFWMADFRQTLGGSWRPLLLINWGIAALLLTPYLRVLASVIYFAAIERNLKYTLFTTFVFSVLTYSLLLR